MQFDTLDNKGCKRLIQSNKFFHLEMVIFVYFILKRTDTMMTLQFVYNDIRVLRLLKVGCRKDNVSLSWSGLKTWMPFDLSSSKINRL